MKIALMLVTLFLASVSARAVDLQWVNPTEYEDGTPLPLQQFQRFDLGCGTPRVVVSTWIDTSTTTRTVPNNLFVRGDNECALRIAVVGSPVTGGQVATSDWSNSVNFDVPTTVPRPPTGLTIVGGAP
jgi:hypothetical protein